MRLGELVRIRNPLGAGLDREDWLGRITSVVIRPGGRHLVKVVTYGDHNEPHVFMTTELRDVGMKAREMDAIVADCLEQIGSAMNPDIAAVVASMASNYRIQGREQRRALYKRIQQEVSSESHS